MRFHSICLESWIRVHGGDSESWHGSIGEMVPSAQVQPSRVLSEQLLITRIITAVGLALLLLLGAAGASHSESEEASSSLLVASTLLDPHLASGEPGSTVDEHMAAADASTAGVLVGAALCALGLLCGLVFVIFARMVSRRRGVAYLVPRWMALWLVPVRIIVARTGALSLTQLGLSRT